MSPSKTILRGAIRLLIRPGLSPRMPVAISRPAATLLARTTPVARGIEVHHTELAGQKAERLAPRDGARPELVLLYFHGGAFRIGSAMMYRGLVTQLAKHTRTEVYAPDYRLAPEHAFPAAHDDAFAAATALLALRPSARLVLAGDSAGGGLALHVARRLRDAGEARLVGTVLLSPWLDLAMTGDSAKTKDAIDPMLSCAGLRFAAEDYLRGTDPEHPDASPLFGSLTGLPPIHIEVGTDEVLLDDTTRLLARANEAGVSTHAEIVPGMWHDFPLHTGVIPEADAAMARIGAFVADLASRAGR